MDLLPIGRSDSKIDPAMGVSLPLENASVGNAGVWAAAAGIEGETLRPDGSGEVDYLRRVEVVVGPRQRRWGEHMGGVESEKNGEDCKCSCSQYDPWVHVLFVCRLIGSQMISY